MGTMGVMRVMGVMAGRELSDLGNFCAPNDQPDFNPLSMRPKRQFGGRLKNDCELVIYFSFFVKMERAWFFVVCAMPRHHNTF